MQQRDAIANTNILIKSDGERIKYAQKLCQNFWFYHEVLHKFKLVIKISFVRGYPKKTSVLRGEGVCPVRTFLRTRGVGPVRTFFSDKRRRGSIFRDFVRTSFMDGP